MALYKLFPLDNFDIRALKCYTMLRVKWCDEQYVTYHATNKSPCDTCILNDMSKMATCATIMPLIERLK